jgi:hypothetical protein
LFASFAGVVPKSSSFLQKLTLAAAAYRPVDFEPNDLNWERLCPVSLEVRHEQPEYWQKLCTVFDWCVFRVRQNRRHVQLFEAPVVKAVSNSDHSQLGTVKVFVTR